MDLFVSLINNYHLQIFNGEITRNVQQKTNTKAWWFRVSYFPVGKRDIFIWLSHCTSHHHTCYNYCYYIYREGKFIKACCQTDGMWSSSSSPVSICCCFCCCCSSCCSYGCWYHHLPIITYRNFDPLVNDMAVFFQLVDDYLNLRDTVIPYIFLRFLSIYPLRSSMIYLLVLLIRFFSIL